MKKNDSTPFRIRYGLSLLFCMVLSVATAQIYIGNGGALHYSGGNFVSGVIDNSNGGTFSVSTDFAHSTANYVDGPVSFLGAAGPFNVSLGSDAVNRAPNFTSTAAGTVSYDAVGVATGTAPVGYTLADAELYTFTGSISAATATPLAGTTYGGVAGTTVVQVYADANGGTWSETLTSGTSTVMTFASVSAETDILTYSFAEQSGAATIDAGNHTVAIEVANGTDVSALVATFTLSDGATATVGGTAQVSGTTANDFSSAVTYTVTAADGTTTQDWTVTVTAATLGIDKVDLNAFALYPNPVKASSRSLNYNLPNGVSQLDIKVFDILGKVVGHYANAPHSSGANAVAKPQVAKGLYIVKFSFNNGEQFLAKRVIIE